MQTEPETLDGIKSRIQQSIDKSVSVTLTLAVVAGLALLLAVLAADQQSSNLRWGRIACGLGVSFAALSGLAVRRRFGSRFAIVWFSILVYVGSTSISIYSGTGVASPGNAAALTLAIISGFMAGPRTGLVASIVALTGIVLLTGAQQLGWISGLTPHNLPPAAAYTVTYLGIFAIAAWVVYEFSKLFWQALAHLDQARHALQEKVTQQSATKAKLLDSEKRLTALLDRTPMAILIFEISNGRLHYANQHALTEHEVNTIEDLEALTDRRSDAFGRAELMHAISHTCEQGPHERQWHSITRSGRERWWSVKLDLLTLNGTEYVAAWAKNITDQITVHQALIDEQFRLEEKVRDRTQELVEQQRQLSAILDALPVALSMKDLDGRYLMCNHVFEQLAARAQSEILGHTDSELFGFSKAFAISHDDAEILESGQSKRSEQDIPSDRDELKDYLITKVPLFDGAQRPQSLLTLATDISDIKALQRELRAATKEAERLAQIKAEFLANMSHEIRTPLNGVLGLAHIGIKEHANTPSAQALFRKITHSGQHLLGVINDILDFSKIDAGKMSIESNCLNPTQTAEEAVGMLREKAKSKGLTLTLQIHNAPNWIHGDSLRIQQILINLLSNAVKFTDKGHVTLSLTQSADSLCFQVSDSGIGMSPQMLSRVFSPFEQADTSTTRQFGGTGLGLTISRQLARLMGGDIEVVSTQGVGSTFTFRLPHQADTSIAAPSPPIKSELPPTPLHGLRILAVDDVDINREVLTSMLESEGATAIQAVHGLDALEQVQHHERDFFDIVLMDVQMPVMDGLAATTQIKTLIPDLPIIALTAHALPEERQRCLEAGMVSHLSKPIDPEQMVQEILNQVRKQSCHPTMNKPSPATAPAIAHQHASPEWRALEGADLSMALARCGGKASVLLKVLHKFSQAQHQFEAQFAPMVTQDLDQARRTAHALKGTAANLGFADISSKAANLEAACSVADLAKIEVALAELSPILEQSLHRLDVWLAEQEETAGMAYNGG